MSTYTICFRGEIRKILCVYPLLSVAMRYHKSFLTKKYGHFSYISMKIYDMGNHLGAFTEYPQYNVL